MTFGSHRTSPSRKRAGTIGEATVLAPMSAIAAELLHRLQQEAADAAAPAPGTVTLPPVGTLRPSSACDGTYLAAYGSGRSNSITLLLNHGRQRPAKWSGSETRYDDHGHRWERNFYAVVDNFGDLVEVPA